MSTDRVELLTDKQRTCLRLVNQHLSSKEIAREVGVSVSAVEQRIKAAVRTLGARDRREAARMLAISDQETCGRTTGGPPVLQNPDPIAILAGQEERGERTEDEQANRLHEAQAAYVAEPQARSRLVLPLPLGGARPDDLSAAARTSWIVGIILAIIFTFGIFLAGVEALSRLALTLKTLSS